MSQGNILNNDSKDELNQNKKSQIKNINNPNNNSIQSKKEMKTKLSKEIFMKKLNESKEFQKMKNLQNNINIDYNKINELNIKNEIRMKNEEKKNKNFIKDDMDEEKITKKLKEDLLPNNMIEIHNQEKNNIELIDEKKSSQIIENKLETEQKKKVNFEDEINKKDENELNKKSDKKELSANKTLQNLNEKIKEKIEKRYEEYKKNNSKNNENNNEEILNFELKINKNKFRPIEKSYTINDKAKLLQKLMLGKNPDKISDKDLQKKEDKNIDNLINQKPIVKKKKKTYKPFILPNEL
jgi:hypothetical protein